ncbi:hypothetical protein SAY87_024460 [Trapa incisa]|uniref:VQ domain-containing protein n=1 Tax=Trapa incisa TaxID=236973 RepID=A0AAN7JFF8_9MYRT|nr:hypothetical protein SAY87_024460 [Trapa incisa]
MASNSGDSSSSASDPSGNGNRETYPFKHHHINKLSHKISKPFIRKPAISRELDPLLPGLTQPAAAAAGAADYQDALPPHQPPQPPVYNINKSDFRDVVQRLTGAPPRDPAAHPPPIPPPSRSSTSTSRLHRIRPPPLAQLAARSPPMIHCAADPLVPAVESSGNPILRPSEPPPMSPLPPLPGVHIAAESPVSAYMRRLRSSSGEPRPHQFSCLSPLAPPQSQSQSQQAPPPLSPLSYRLIPPVSMFPPSLPNQLTGFPFPQLPLSPTVPSPKP